MNFSADEISEIQNHGLSIEDVDRQLKDFEQGFPFINLIRPATIGDGIKNIPPEQATDLVNYYDSQKDKFDILKFVPSSGAATRMMKDLYSFLNDYKDEYTTPLHTFPVAYQTIKNLTNFAFFKALNQYLKRDGISIDSLMITKDYKTIIEYIISEKGLNYGKSPKAWILFHNDNSTPITAFEQHLQEAAQYANSNGKARLHFTITEEHLEGFEKLKQSLVDLYQHKYNLLYDVEFSFQSHSTDTVAVDKDNKIVKDTKGHIVFRPSGHGALIDNLNKIDADIIFIKNIDNISSIYKKETIYYKKLLAALLIKTKSRVDYLANRLSDREQSINKDVLNKCYLELKDDLGFQHIKPYEKFNDTKSYREYLFQFVNRPLRVCGMVRNTGEPGGGPFYVGSTDEAKQEETAQIVEKSQINIADNNQRAILEASTHFNPVDLVIATKDFRGNKFDLTQFVDSKTGFISEKSFEGKQIKAMERPGLWNGAMAGWLTIFVQVPIQTFNPVKVLTDLLKDAHR